MNLSAEQIVEMLEAWVIKKRTQADMNDHEHADAYRKGAASAQNVASDEIMDIVLAAK
ncbi:hypothetical protein Xoosp13_28 [Xanthomonas phage Xoo-sp13]|nr:hypothetical protein Xoosp13_28 [Xanthomonas phage Xoo-sp13]